MTFDNMHNIPLVPSTLKVVASECIDVSEDLNSIDSNKSIAELINDEKTEEDPEQTKNR